MKSVPGKTPLLALLLLFGALSAKGPTPALAQQGSATHYVYDENGRLRAVIAPNGEANIYDYDPAGNITAIRRLGTNALELLSFTPHSGAVGDQVMFFGVGFKDGVNSVSFNGVTAKITSATLSVVTAEVPLGATTGPVTLVTPRGTLTTAIPFTVKGVSLSPRSVTLVPFEERQFTAFASTATGDATVSWSVSGVEGGNNIVGTITPGGLYAAPSLPSGQASAIFIVRATSLAEPDLFREAQVIVKNLNNISGLVALSVAVYLAPTPGSQITTATPSQSVSVYVVPSTGTQTIAATPFGAVAVYLTPPAGSQTTTATPYYSVAVTTGPYLTSIAPGSLTRGSTATLTINGANLAGASRLIFLLSDGTADPNITANNISVRGDGTALTASVMVNSDAAPGARSVVIITGAIVSTAASNSARSVQIQ